jgi:hypothetical protein
MPQALLVEKFDVNPTTLLGSLTISDEASVRSELSAAVQAYNANAVVRPVEGALVWSDTDAARRYEFRVGDGLREQRFGECKKLVGYYTCESGRTYWYFGKCVSWVPWKRTYWEVYLYRHDKKFIYDGVFDSKDLLGKLGEDLLRIEIGIDLLHAVSLERTKESIEEWDKTRGGIQRAFEESGIRGSPAPTATI